MERFLDVLRTQRWDDHRYYHHSRINQSLHLVSAISFLFAYVMIFKDPAMAALVGWLLGMTTRQIGHFFFEPHTYDKVNQASHEHKESIKVGYNLQRKVVLLSIWALSPLPLLVDPSYFGVFTPHTNANEFVRHVAQIWLAIGLGGVVFRVVQLMRHQGRRDRFGLGGENHHRSFPRHQDLLVGAVSLAAGRADRPQHRRSLGRRGSRGVAASQLGFNTRVGLPMIAEGAEPMRDHLFQNTAFDCLVCQAGLAPPPPVRLHLLCRCDEAISHRLDVGLGVIEAEDQPAAADPTQRQPFRAKVILQHPVIARRLRVADRPDRRDVGDSHRQALLREPPVQARRPGRSTTHPGYW